jgi:hypothetical protein
MEQPELLELTALLVLQPFRELMLTRESFSPQLILWLYLRVGLRTSALDPQVKLVFRGPTTEHLGKYCGQTVPQRQHHGQLFQLQAL